MARGGQKRRARIARLVLERSVARLDEANVNLRMTLRYEQDRAQLLHDFIYHQTKLSAAVANLFSMARSTCAPVSVDVDDEVPF